MTIDLLNAIKDKVSLDEATQNFYKLEASIHVLKQSNLINQAFLDNHKSDQASLLIHIYGLLQNLFVSIDALYDMTKATMSHKYSVNVNMNKNLHELKYIRNDIVGHPTNRTYQTGGIGFSLMRLDETSIEKIVYETHLFKKKHHDIIKREVKTADLIRDYEVESNQIIKEVHDYLNQDKKPVKLSIWAFKFLESLELSHFDHHLLQKIKDSYISDNDLPSDTHNRLIWRINLLEMLNNWKEVDQDKSEYIEYMKLEQAVKIYVMASNIEQVKPQYVNIKVPKLLQSFYRFIKKDESRLKYVKTLKDFDHPYFKADLLELKVIAKTTPNVVKLLSWLEKQTNGNKVYTIGSTLEKYDSNR